MPNIATVLKSEISRVARKEVRAEIEALKKASSQHRSAIAALRRQLDAAQKELKRLSKNVTGAAAKQATDEKSESSETRRRFSPSRLAAHRKKMELSAVAYGKLVGIGGQTIYNWEQGKSRPNASQIEELAIIKELNRTALMKRLGNELP